MKKLGCSEMGFTCSFVATGATNAEVKQKLAAHGMKAHADKMKNLGPKDMKKMDDMMNKLLARQK
jgi:predicted small metal-binding protein